MIPAGAPSAPSRLLLLAGLALCLAGTGCLAAADLGAKFAGAVIESAMKSGTGGSSGYSGPEARTTTEGLETPCRRRLEEWHKANGGSVEDAPAYMRCKPNGDWPDEETVRSHARPGM